MSDDAWKDRFEELLGTLTRCRQEVSELLPQMYREGHPELNSALAYAHESGFTLDALGSMLGLSGERVRQRIVAGDPPPRDPPFHASAEEVDELLRLHAAADGRSPAKSKATAEYRAFLAGLRRRGATLPYLADLLGVTHKAVAFQLQHHERAEVLGRG